MHRLLVSKFFCKPMVNDIDPQEVFDSLRDQSPKYLG